MLNRFHDAVAATTDAEVLIFHDCSRTETVICVEISCEGGYGGHADDDLVLLAVLIRSNATLDDGGSNLVPDGVLCITCCCDEELVFDVDEVPAVADDSDVCVCDGVLED